MQWPSDIIDFVSTHRRFYVRPLKVTTFKLIVTGKLIYKQIPFERSFDFTITIKEKPVASQCLDIFYQQVNDDVNWPIYQLREFTDPGTGEPGQYKVSIPEELQQIFSYSENK